MEPAWEIETWEEAERLAPEPPGYTREFLVSEFWHWYDSLRYWVGG